MATLGYTAGIRFRTRGSAITGQSDGDALTTGEILDESGNDYTPTIFHTPNYKVAGPNVQPYIKVNGAAEAWGAIKLPTAFYTDGGAPDGTSGAAVYVVVRVDSATPGGLGHGGPWNSFGGEGSGSADDGDHYPLPDGSAIEMSFCSSAHRTIPLTGIPQDLTEWHLLRMRSATDFWDVMISGAIVYADASSSFRFDSPPAADSTEIGDSGVNNIFKGDVAEVIFYDHIPSAANDLVVLQYIADEYDLDFTGGALNPFISGAADSTTQITVTVTPGAGATDHSLYRSTSPGFTPGPGNLLASGLGAAPAPYVDTGLTAGTTYYYRAVETASGRASNLLSVTTSGATSGGTLRVDAVGDGFVIVSLAGHPSYVTIAFFRDTNAIFPAPVSVVQGGPGMETYTAAGLVNGTEYFFRAQPSDATGPVALSNTVSATPAVIAGLPASSAAWVAPAFAEPITSGVVSFEWLPIGGNVVSLEVSPAYATSWTEIADSATLGSATFYAWDASMETDGLWYARITFADATVAEHPGFIIDNATGGHEYFPEMTPGLPDGTITDWGALLDDAQFWVWGRFADGQCQNHTGVNTAVSTVFGQIGGGWDPSVLVPHNVTPTSGDEGFVAGTVSVNSAGGPIVARQFFYGAEYTKAGVAWARGTKAGGDQMFIAAYVLNGQLGHYFFGGSNCGQFGQGAGAFVLQIADGQNQVNYVFSEPVNLAASHGNLGCNSQCYSRAWRYNISLEWSRPDPMSNPNRYTILARLGAPYNVVIEETVDVEQPDGTPVFLGCGSAGFFSAHQQWGSNDNGWRQTYNLTSRLVDTQACDIPPPPPPTPIPFPTLPPPSFPCALHYQHFQPDGRTIDWEASSDPTIADGYLMEPTAYAEQEVDFLQGRASITSVTVAFIDPPATVGNQTTGVTTGRLGRL